MQLGNHVKFVYHQRSLITAAYSWLQLLILYSQLKLFRTNNHEGTTNMIFAKALLAVTLITLSGICMPLSSFNPFNKEVVLMSPLKGTLMQGGKILAHTDIEVIIVMPGGEERIYKHKTDENGIFDLPVIKDRMTLGPMTEFAVSQYVEANVNGETYEIWVAGKREPGLFAERTPPAETIGLVCELEEETESYRESTGFIMTRCKWKSTKEI